MSPAKIECRTLNSQGRLKDEQKAIAPDGELATLTSPLIGEITATSHFETKPK